MFVPIVQSSFQASTPPARSPRISESRREDNSPTPSGHPLQAAEPPGKYRAAIRPPPKAGRAFGCRSLRCAGLDQPIEISPQPQAAHSASRALHTPPANAAKAIDTPSYHLAVARKSHLPTPASRRDHPNFARFARYRSTTEQSSRDYLKKGLCLPYRRCTVRLPADGHCARQLCGRQYKQCPHTEQPRSDRWQRNGQKMSLFAGNQRANTSRQKKEPPDKSDGTFCWEGVWSGLI